MSYCRFSSDNWRSDVYAYEHYLGFYQIHVARNRTVGDAPVRPDIDTTSSAEWQQAFKEQMAWLDKAERVQIGLPLDGATFTLDTALECAAKLVELRDMGYRVPGYAIERLKEEAHGE